MNILSSKKTYELPLGREYVRHWGMSEAIREIIQNALDSESPFEYEIDEHALHIHSRYTILPKSTLLLGSTTKAEAQNKIGSFGEGYKIALLVLARNNYPVVMRNGDRNWTPVFRQSKMFDAEVLCIEDAPAEIPNQGLTFSIAGLSPSDVETIRESCLQMQSQVGEFLSTPYGRILRERPGKLYVGGLYVCDTELKFGYDILPQHLRLERDRQTVSTWDLQLKTKEMWFSTGRFDEIAELISLKTPDVEYAEYGAPEMVREACFKLFKKKYPGKMIARNQEELDEMIKQGMTETVVISGAYGSMIRTAPSYEAAPVKPKASPKEILQFWFTAHRKSLLKPARDSFPSLILQADDWRHV